MAITLQKVGPHIQTGSSNASAWAQVANVVKSMDNVGVLQSAKPGALLIFRHYFANQDINRNGGDMAQEVINALGGFRSSNLYCECYNEPPGEQSWTADFAKRLTFERQAADRFHANGIKYAGFCFSTGTPGDAPGAPAGNPDAKNAWSRIADAGWCGADAIALHEYGCCGGGEGDYWNLYRHELVHQWLSDMGHASHPPFIITETGIDNLPPFCQNWGWTKCGWSAARMAQWCKDYDNRLAGTSYVIGATAFTCAPNSSWTTFNMDSVVPEIIGNVTCTPAPCCAARDALCAFNSQFCQSTCDQLHQKLCHDDCTLFTGNDPIRVNFCGTSVCPHDQQQQCLDAPACCNARDALKAIDGRWATADCNAIHNEVCHNNCSIFTGNNPIRVALCGTSTCPHDSQPPCPDCPHGDVYGCPPCPTQEGLSPLVVAAGIVGMALMGVIFAMYSGIMEAEEAPEPGEVYVSDVQPWQAGAPLPPGWVAVS